MLAGVAIAPQARYPLRVSTKSDEPVSDEPALAGQTSSDPADEPNRVAAASPTRDRDEAIEAEARAHERRRARRARALDDETVPRLPRGRGFRLSSGALLKVALTGALLVMLIVVQRPCADSVSKFVTGFDELGSASVAMPKPGTVDVGSGSQHFEHIGPNMTEAERTAAIQRELDRARAASSSAKGSAAGSASTGSGSAAGKSAGSGSATGSGAIERASGGSSR